MGDICDLSCVWYIYNHEIGLYNNPTKSGKNSQIPTHFCDVVSQFFPRNVEVWAISVTCPVCGISTTTRLDCTTTPPNPGRIHRSRHIFVMLYPNSFPVMSKYGRYL